MARRSNRIAPEPPPQLEVAPFILSLVEILESQATQHICSWCPGGTSFLITDPDAFSRQILARRFKSDNFQSFVRQLNFYAFRKTAKSRDLKQGACEFVHPHFVRGRPDLMARIRRKTSQDATAKSELSSLRGEVDELRDQLGAVVRGYHSAAEAVAAAKAALVRAGLHAEAAAIADPEPVDRLLSPDAHGVHSRKRARVASVGSDGEGEEEQEERQEEEGDEAEEADHPMHTTAAVAAPSHSRLHTSRRDACVQTDPPPFVASAVAVAASTATAAAPPPPPASALLGRMPSLLPATPGLLSPPRWSLGMSMSDAEPVGFALPEPPVPAGVAAAADADADGDCSTSAAAAVAASTATTTAGGAGAGAGSLSGSNLSEADLAKMRQLVALMMRRNAPGAPGAPKDRAAAAASSRPASSSFSQTLSGETSGGEEEISSNGGSTPASRITASRSRGAVGVAAPAPVPAPVPPHLMPAIGRVPSLLPSLPSIPSLSAPTSGGVPCNIVGGSAFDLLPPDFFDEVLQSNGVQSSSGGGGAGSSYYKRSSSGGFTPTPTSLQRTLGSNSMSGTAAPPPLLHRAPSFLAMEAPPSALPPLPAMPSLALSRVDSFASLSGNSVESEDGDLQLPVAPASTAVVAASAPAPATAAPQPLRALSLTTTDDRYSASPLSEMDDVSTEDGEESCFACPPATAAPAPTTAPAASASASASTAGELIFGMTRHEISRLQRAFSSLPRASQQGIMSKLTQQLFERHRHASGLPAHPDAGDVYRSVMTQPAATSLLHITEQVNRAQYGGSSGSGAAGGAGGAAATTAHRAAHPAVVPPEDFALLRQCLERQAAEVSIVFLLPTPAARTCLLSLGILTSAAAALALHSSSLPSPSASAAASAAAAAAAVPAAVAAAHLQPFRPTSYLASPRVAMAKA